MQPEATVGGRLAEINQQYLDRDSEPRDASAIKAMLDELTDLALQVNTEPAADQPATVARLTEVRKLCSAWYNDVSAAQSAPPGDLDRGAATEPEQQTG